MTIFGEPIEVNGVRPDWLKDDEIITVEYANGDGWSAFKLPADHPYYIVQAYNTEHKANFTYWPGGESAPDDWDHGVVMLRNGDTLSNHHFNWNYYPSIGRTYPDFDIIGYVRKNVAVCSAPAEGLLTEPKPDNFASESPIRAFTDWQVDGCYALGKGFRPSLAHITNYLDAMRIKEGWKLVQVFEPGSNAPSFLFEKV